MTTNYEYTTTLQPISVYGYRFATATVTAVGDTATDVSFGRDVQILARLDTGADTPVVTTNPGKIPTSITVNEASVATKVGDKFYFLVQ